MVRRIAVVDSLSMLSAPDPHVTDTTPKCRLPGHDPVYKRSGGVALVAATELRGRQGLGKKLLNVLLKGEVFFRPWMDPIFLIFYAGLCMSITPMII